MTRISRVSVQNVRSHTAKKITLHPNTTILIGKNGAGKTSLLEAIYIALQGSSFKGTDHDILRHNYPWWRIDIEVDKNPRSVKYTHDAAKKKKEFIIFDKTLSRLTSKNKLPVVLFEPDDLQLLSGSPSKRRDFIDTLITHIDPQYSQIMKKYERALQQRNSLLKQGIRNPEYYFSWNITLAEYGASIIARRARIIEKINQVITQEYKNISHTSDEIKIITAYTPDIYTPEKLLEDLDASFEKDLLIKHTTTGPHRHDITITINDQSSSTTASRGEVRTIILSLKFIELVVIEEITHQQPTLLLDDVFSELDEDRQKNLLNSTYQTIVTTTMLPDTLKSAKNCKIIKI